MNNDDEQKAVVPIGLVRHRTKIKQDAIEELRTIGVRIAHASEIGLKTRAFYMWLPCMICGKGRWVRPKHDANKCAECHKVTWLRRSGSNHRMWKGGRTVDKDGYIVLAAGEEAKKFLPNEITKYTVREHRLVMAMHLNRPLKRTETVHHKNGNKQDNRIENLELWSGNHGSGFRVSDYIKHLTVSELESLKREIEELLWTKTTHLQ